MNKQKLIYLLITVIIFFSPVRMDGPDSSLSQSNPIISDYIYKKIAEAEIQKKRSPAKNKELKKQISYKITNFFKTVKDKLSHEALKKNQLTKKKNFFLEKR